MRNRSVVLCSMLLTLTALSGHSGAQAPPPASWPPGVLPGNLYLIEFQDPAGFQGVPTTLMVASLTPADAVRIVRSSYESERQSNNWLKTLPAPSFTVVKECNGPNWGAVLFVGDDQDSFRSGAACGAATPGEAIRAAARACRPAGRGSCESSPFYFQVNVGHSGSAPMSPEPHFGGHPTVNFALSAATATNELIFMNDPVTTHSVQESIDKMGQACGVHSCFMTWRNAKCIFEIPDETDPDGSRHRASYKCVDKDFTASGIGAPAPAPKPVSKARAALDALYNIIK